MDKKSILILIAAVAGLVSWQLYQGKRMAEYRVAKEAYDQAIAEEAAKNPPPAAAPETTAPAAAAPPAAAAHAPVQPAAEPALEKAGTSLVDYTFTNLGGGIRTAKLLEHIIDKKSGADVVMNEFGGIPIGAVSEKPGEGIAQAFEMKSDALKRAVVFERVDERQIALTKTFTLPEFDSLDKNTGERLREEYLLRLDLTFQNRAAAPVALPAYYVYTGSTAALHSRDLPHLIGLDYFREDRNKFIDSAWFDGAGILMFKKPPSPVYPAAAEPMQDVRWAAVTNQYFASFVAPIVDPKALSAEQVAQRGIGVWGRRFTITPEQWQEAGRGEAGGNVHYGVDGAIAMSGLTLEPGASATRSFDLFVGPREYRRLREFEDSQAELLDFGMFGWISKGLLNSMNGLKEFLGSYWAAIILLTLCIRGAMWPLQNRATQTAKKMQALSPMIKELQAKHKDDPVKLQQETSKLWKEYGVNPIGGCLPMLIQIPIFFGFYNMLNKAVELRNDGFLWVQDLSQPDTIFHIPGIGLPFNPLPLFMAATMLWQMQLSPKTGDPMQQRIMMFMPLIFIVLCYNYASALALYWTVQNLFSIVQLYVTRDKTTPEPQKIAVAAMSSAPAKKKR